MLIALHHTSTKQVTGDLQHRWLPEVKAPFGLLPGAGGGSGGSGGALSHHCLSPMIKAARAEQGRTPSVGEGASLGIERPQKTHALYIGAKGHVCAHKRDIFMACWTL